jgi:membrane protein DedA with SNARE-associated domain
MEDWILDVVEQGGYFGIFVLMVLENVFPPIPSELIMGLGGIAVGRGQLDFWPLLAVGTLGATIGNYAWFLAGDRLGYQRLQPLVDRWGRWLTLEWQDIERARTFFNRHGHWVVFFLRFSPMLRTVVSLPAGLAHMPRVKFLAFTFAGTAVWNAALIAGGSWLAQASAGMQGMIGWIVLGTTGLALAAYLWRVITWRPRGGTGPED